MPTRNAIRNQKFKTIARELNPTIDDLCWMARNGELLPPSPTPADDPELSSRLYGPSMKTVQLERVEVIELDENGRVVWRA